MTLAKAHKKVQKWVTIRIKKQREDELIRISTKSIYYLCKADQYLIIFYSYNYKFK